MSVIFLLIPLSIILAAGFLLAFAWAVRSGQYEDTSTPSMRVLLDEPAREPMAGSSLKAGPRTGSRPSNSNKT
jgi:cbb3-type cytochrome oxidase maturation protein